MKFTERIRKPSVRRLTPLHGIAAFVIIMLLFSLCLCAPAVLFRHAGAGADGAGASGLHPLAVRITGQSFRSVFPIGFRNSAR